MARWTASAKWAVGPALDGRRATLLGLGLNEGLDRSFRTLPCARSVSKPVAENFVRFLLRTGADTHNTSGHLNFGLVFMVLLAFFPFVRFFGSTWHRSRPSSFGACLE